MAWGESRICLYPECKRRQWKPGLTDDEFFDQEIKKLEARKK